MRTIDFLPGIPGIRLSQQLLKSFPDMLYGILGHFLVQSISEPFGQSFWSQSFLIFFSHVTPPIKLIRLIIYKNLNRTSYINPSTTGFAPSSLYPNTLQKRILILFFLTGR